jgi:hypothetical protein
MLTLRKSITYPKLSPHGSICSGIEKARFSAHEAEAYGTPDFVALRALSSAIRVAHPGFSESPYGIPPSVFQTNLL